MKWKWPVLIRFGSWKVRLLNRALENLNTKRNDKQELEKKKQKQKHDCERNLSFRDIDR